MIQELNQRPSTYQAFNKGMLNTYEPMLQRELQRQQTKRAIGELRQSSRGASPTDLLYNLIEASSLSPEIGRSLGPLYEAALRSQNAQNAPSALSNALATMGGGLSSQGQYQPEIMSQTAQAPKEGFQPGTQLAPEETAEQLSKQKTGRDIQNLSNQYLNQVRPDLFQPSQFGNIPTFDTQTKSALRPEEEAKIRRNMNASGISPEQQEQVLSKINEDIGNKYKEALKNYDIAQGQQQAIDQKWNVIKQDADTQLKPFISNFGPKTQQLLKDKYFQYAGSQPINQTPEAVENQSMALLQRDMNQLNALEQIPSIPPVRWGGVKQSMDSIKKAYAPLKAQGMQEALLEDAIYNKDAGIEESHELVYGDQTNKKTLNDINNVKRGDDRNKYIDDVSKQLIKLGPDDDLILARSMVLGNGGDISEFSEALSQAIENGLQLSPFQESQLQEIQIPRIRPLWEIFSEGEKREKNMGLYGIAGQYIEPYISQTFKHFLNYVRGKK